MSYYRSAFCTLNQVLTQYGLTDAATIDIDPETQAVIDNLDTGQKILLKQLIYDASDEIIIDYQRMFVPFVNAYTVRPSMKAAWSNWRYENGILRYYLQDLAYADLLSLSAVSVDGSTITDSYYRLEGNAPYDAITFDSTGVTLSSGFSSNAVLTGTWGYHENPAMLWRSIGTLQANLSDSATSFVATAGTVAEFETFQYLKIESELLFVTNVLSIEPYTVTVERGVRGSTAAAHVSTTAISAYRQMPIVIKATRRRVINLMQKRAELANILQTGETTFEISSEDIDLPESLIRYVAVKSI